VNWTWTGLIMLPWTPTLDDRTFYIRSLRWSRLPIPVFIDLPFIPAPNPVVGRCMFLNTSNEGDIFADIDFFYDDDQVVGFYPEVDLDHNGELAAIGLGTRPIWRQLRPITRPSEIEWKPRRFPPLLV